MGINITGIGNANAIGFKSKVVGGGTYLSPELKDALVGVWSAYGKSNNSTDRNIIKNKIKDKGGDFVISNAAYEGMSGYNGYPVVFGRNKTWTYAPVSEDNGYIYTSDSIKYNIKQIIISTALCYSHVKREGVLTSYNKDVESFKIKVTGIKSEIPIKYFYLSSTDATATSSISIKSDGIYKLPKSFANDGSLIDNYCWIGFGFTRISADIPIIITDVNITIEILPEFEGAFVTDGVDDLITSTKTVSEMGITDEITIVSMIHQVKFTSSASITNDIRVGTTSTSSSNGRNVVSSENKTGIYGWSRGKSIPNLITGILGDKNDYSVSGEPQTNYNNKFSVVGTADNRYNSSVAWYWTIIANKVLTTDEINQVIAYYNLDRTLKPDILCNVKKQRITNDNHAEFGDKLIDFSGNGRDIQLNNIAWNKESGIDDNGALCLDGVNDFGKVTGMPIYKDYTFIIDYKRISYASSERWVAGVVSKSYVASQGAFILMTANREVEPVKQTYSFGGITSLYRDDFTRALVYQNKYKFGDVNLTVGEGVDGDTMWLGTFRDNDARFFNGAIYSLMSFPYSMSEFLIERQLKKHKLGTLYPNMVEFRPVINSNVLLDSKPTFVIRGTSTHLNAGDYVPENSQIWVSIKMNNIADRITKFTVNGKTIDIPENAYSEVTLQYGFPFVIDKSPQKISITIEQDENYVKFEPIITANTEHGRISYYNASWNPINVGDYLEVGARANIVIARLNIEKITEIKVSNAEYVGYNFDEKLNHWNVLINLTSKSPQNINITIDEYIRYEDIIQPYPVLLRFNDENGNEVSWGGKFKVGSTITRIGSIDDTENNLLNGLYSTNGLTLNGKAVTSSTSIVEKQMVFKTTATYLLDDNEPKVVLSPSRLRIPNSSYKILGHIPDISGHGNHGVIHNSAYAEGSGVNEDGSYQFDGVDDFVSIPTATGGKQVFMKVNWEYRGTILYDQRGYVNEFAVYTGDVNIPDSIAYDGRNNGKTYIDGILNSNILSSQLRNITHNITITNELNAGVNTTNPRIGITTNGTNYGKFRFYDFMLFDNISTDDKIKELNEYVGIEAKVEKPDYYWDAYGKTNSDDDRSTIQQRGTAVGDYDLTNYNHAYDKMSGYGGYEFAKFDNKEWTAINREDGIEVIERNAYSFTAKRIGAGTYFYDFSNRSIKTLNRPLTLKAVSNNNTRITWDYKYRTAEKPDVDSTIRLVSKEMTPNVPITVTLPYKTEQEKADLGVTEGSDLYLFYFDPSDIPIGEEYTVEMLPLYPDGLVYDGVTDYSENVNIPMFDDFTFLVKSSLLNGFTGSGGCIARKGNIEHVTSGGYAFVYCLDSSSSEASRNSYYSFGKALLPSAGAVDPPLIGYMTKTSVNGVATTFGTNPDIKGISFGDWAGGRISMVVYKSILYSKTISLLEINFLKNLMEKDGIIDINHPIFISNTEDENNTLQDT